MQKIVSEKIEQLSMSQGKYKSVKNKFQSDFSFYPGRQTFSGFFCKTKSPFTIANGLSKNVNSLYKKQDYCFTNLLTGLCSPLLEIAFIK